MSTDSYYAIKLSFHPEPKIKSKKQFTTRKDAQGHIDAFGKTGDTWIILKKSNDKYTFIKGFRYQ